jgi:hypothetical protein
MSQIVESRVAAIAIIDALVQHHNNLVRYAAGLGGADRQLYNREIAVVQAGCGAYLEAMDLVADTFGIDLHPVRQLAEAKDAGYIMDRLL